MSDIRGRIPAVPFCAVSRRCAVGWVRSNRGCGGYCWGSRYSNHRSSRGLTQGRRCVADAVPVGAQPGDKGVFMISKYQQLTLQGEGWQAREWRQNGGIVVYEETATAHFVSTAVCRTETLSVDGLH